MSHLRETPLSGWHRRHGARMVDFAGYDMPVRYQGVLQEHRRVRESCGLFDVSHMGELLVYGPNARAAVDALMTNNVAALAVGQVLYTAMCREDGTVIDDLLIYCLDDDRFMIVCNAANHERVSAWIREHLPDRAEFDDQTQETALLALQGPKSAGVLRSWSRLANHEGAVERLEYYRACELNAGGIELLLSRTGYTGERGYELYVPASRATMLWDEILEAGTEYSLAPIGLGARDTLRLEAGYSLYGHELDDRTTPLEAGIGWVVKLKGREFVGREALARQREKGAPRRTVGIQLSGRYIPRDDASVFHRNARVGQVTSGTFSPTLERGIALVRLRADASGGPLEVEVRGQRVPAELVSLPFVASRVRG